MVDDPPNQGGGGLGSFILPPKGCGIVMDVDIIPFAQQKVVQEDFSHCAFVQISTNVLAILFF